MKNMIIFVAFYLFLIRSFGQQIASSPPSKTQSDYLQKSHKQKNAAWGLVGSGAALIIAGSLIMDNEVKKYSDDPGINLHYGTTGQWIVLTGVFAAAGSIPLFVASKRNKRKAMSLSLKEEPFQHIENSSVVYKPIPAVSLKISL